MNGWDACDYCNSKGCGRCGNLGRVLSKGYKYCPECDGFGTIGFDDSDPHDMGSFEEVCPTCNGDGTVEK